MTNATKAGEYKQMAVPYLYLDGGFKSTRDIQDNPV
jgi:hypothetical protein